MTCPLDDVFASRRLSAYTQVALDIFEAVRYPHDGLPHPTSPRGTGSGVSPPHAATSAEERRSALFVFNGGAWHAQPNPRTRAAKPAPPPTALGPDDVAWCLMTWQLWGPSSASATPPPPSRCSSPWARSTPYRPMPARMPPRSPRAAPPTASTSRCAPPPFELHRPCPQQSCKRHSN
jgi:hypothetical protein